MYVHLGVIGQASGVELLATVAVAVLVRRKVRAMLALKGVSAQG